jgi:two-component system chemotaxis sensor kinase CheA
MDNFRKKFIEEATEHINELEKALLELERDPENKELVEKVFRIMHSLKGGGAMFGFDKISDFTHNLENVYDLVRSGQMYVSKELLDATLASVDHLSNLLNDDKINLTSTIEKHKELSSRIEQIIAMKQFSSDAVKKIKEQNKGDNTTLTNTKEEKISTYYILFQPHETIFDNGTNPLYLLDELS